MVVTMMTQYLVRYWNINNVIVGHGVMELGFKKMDVHCIQYSCLCVCSCMLCVHGFQLIENSLKTNIDIDIFVCSFALHKHNKTLEYAIPSFPC